MTEPLVTTKLCVNFVRKAMPEALAPFGDDFDALIEESAEHFIETFEERSRVLTPLQGLWNIRKFNNEDEKTQAEIWKTTQEVRRDIHMYFQQKPEGSPELSENVYGKVIRNSIDLYMMMYPTRHEPQVGMPVTDRYAEIYKPAKEAFLDSLHGWDERFPPKNKISEPDTQPEKGFGHSLAEQGLPART